MKKVTIIAASVISIIFILLLLTPVLFKDKIATLFKAQINNQLTAKVDYGDVSLSLINTFPHFAFAVEELTISQNQDTLLKIKKTQFVIDVMSVWEGKEYDIIQLSLEEPIVKAKINQEGIANWDIVKKDSTQETADSTSPLRLSIRFYSIKDATVSYSDIPAGMNLFCENLNYSGKGKLDGKNAEFSHLLEIGQTTFRKNGVDYLSKVNLTANSKTMLEGELNKITLDESTIKVNNLEVNLNGSVRVYDSLTNLDLKLATPKTDFKTILSLIPAFYQKDFDQIKTKGEFTFTGEINGNIKAEELPAMNLQLTVRQGFLQYPNLPTSIEKIALDLKIAKPQGAADLVTVDARQVYLEIGGNPIDGNIFLSTPLSDPNIKTTLKGKLDLGTIQAIYPLENVKKLEGVASADINLAARKSDVINKRYQQIQADGYIQAQDVKYEAKSGGYPVAVKQLDLQFNPRNVTVSSFKATAASSELEAKGTLDNFLEYILGEDTIYAQLDVNCNQVIAAEWMPPSDNNAQAVEKTENEKKNTNTGASYFKVPGNIHFSGKAAIGKLNYDKIILENVKANWQMADSRLTLQTLSANALDGQLSLKGFYDSKTENKPFATLDYSMQNMDIQKVYKQVGMAEKIAPVIKHVKGTFNANISLDIPLSETMEVNYNQLSGEGRIQVPLIQLVDVPLLKQIGQIAKVPGLQQPEARNISLSLKISDGQITVQPYTIPFGNGYKATVEGSHSLDNNMNYAIRLDVPGKELSQATGLIQQYIPPIPGISFKMPETVNFYLRATGSYEKPKVVIEKVSADGKSSIQDAITDRLKEEAKKLEEEAKRRAKDEAEKLQKELQDKAKAETDRLKKEAERQAREAAEKAKREAEKGIRDIFKFPK